MKVLRQVSGIGSGETQFTPPRSALIAAGLVIGATYFYFLIFAEFALLELAAPLAGEEPWRLRGLMLALGVGGLAGSAWSALWFDVLKIQARLSWSFRGCAVGAALALSASVWPVLMIAAVVSGVALGALTVQLAASLRPVIGTSRLGWVIGIGTGAAYALCNVPWVFEAGARTQTILAAVVAAMASVASPFLMPQEPSVSPESDYSGKGLLRWVGILLVLVWLDSAAFYVIQHTPELHDATWGGSAHLWANAVTHLVVAVAAGAWMDRGARVSIPTVGFGLLALGCAALGTVLTRQASLLYAAGVSLYSVALVYYPARSGRAWHGAVVYGVAGWVGSALGIGMAQDMDGVPGLFLGLAGAVVVAMVLWRWRVHGTLVLVGAMSAIMPKASAAQENEKENDALIRGREVYIAEGCIHCHSQYLRPTVEAERLAAAGVRTDPGSPPLFGNRRQGPDLMTVGLRLPAAAWHREHLMDPRRVRPGSRMPSYAHLFAEGDERGQALVMYLVSLGNPQS